MNYFEIEIQGKLRKLWAIKQGSKLWLHCEGETWGFEPVKARRQRGSAPAKIGNHLDAPMPGKIIKLFVAEGDAVEIHQTVLAMEAMKMEYVLKSAVKGKVRKIHCQSGEQVALAQLLVEIDPEEA